MPIGDISVTVGLRGCAMCDASADWQLIKALLGGTERMRDERAKWLPKEPKEMKKAYDLRVSRSVLFPGFEEAIDTVTEKPFSHMLRYKGSANQTAETLEKNADAAGTSLHNFASEAFKGALTWGAHYGMADLPSSIGGEEGRTAENELTEKAFLTGIAAPDMLGWKTRRTASGTELVQVRYVERREEDIEGADQFDESVTEYVKVVFKDSWQLWQETENSANSRKQSEWRMAAEGQHSLGRVPLRHMRFGRPVGHMAALPPFRNLAWMNLRHFQSDTDQENILRFARVPLLHYAGGDAPNENDPDQYGQITIGPNRVVRSRNADARLEHVEHNGNAIRSGEESLDTVMARMQALGLSPLKETGKSNTATGRIIDASGNDNSAKSWVRRTEEFIYGLIEDASEFNGEELSEDFCVDLFDDFTITNRPDSELAVLQKDRERGDLDIQTYHDELRRRGVLSTDVSTDVVVDRLMEEIPPMDAEEDNLDEFGQRIVVP